MLLDKIITTMIVILVNVLLFKKYINGYSRLNLLAIIMCIFGFSLYAYSSLNDVDLKIYIQIILLFIMVIIPFVVYLICNKDKAVDSKKMILKAKKLMQTSKFDDARDMLLKCIEIDDKNKDIYYLLGILDKQNEDFENAIANFMKAVELDKRSYLSYYELGCIFESQNKLDTAIIMLSNSNKIKPDFYDAAELLGICYTSLKKYDEAIEVYEDALKYYPDSYELNYNIAISNLEIGDINSAEEYLIKATKLSDKPYGSCYSLGNIYYMREKYQNALENYKVSRFSKEFFAASMYKMAIIYCKTREYENATVCIKYSILADEKYFDMAKKELVFGNIIDEILKFNDIKIKITMNYTDDKLLNRLLEITSDSNFLNESKINLL